MIKPSDEPSPAPTGPVRPISRRSLWLYGICRFISVEMTRVYLPGDVLGAQHLPKDGPYVLAPVHRSNIDWLVVARITRRRLRYLVKDEIWKFKPMGQFLEMLGAFPVNRHSADRESFNRALEILLAGEPLVVFPEGTRGAGPLVSELREGAAYLALRAGVPIVPVGIAGTEKAMPRGARLPRPGRVIAVVGPPLVVSRAERAEQHSARIARSATRALTAQLSEAIQTCLTAAQAELNKRQRNQPLGFGAEPREVPPNGAGGLSETGGG